MKNILISVSLVISLLVVLLLGCPTNTQDNPQNNNTNNTNQITTKIVPSKFMVDVPDSIQNDPNAGPFDPRKSGSGSGSYARDQIAMTVEQMQGEIKNILFQLMYIDEIVKDLSPSDTLIEDKTITITQEFIEKMKYFAPDDFVRE